MKPINFSQGINTKTDPIDTPEGSYRDATNMRISGLSKRSEEGTIISKVPTNFVQWGSCPIGDESILLGQINGKSVIGSLSNEDEWEVLVPPRATEVLYINKPTQAEGKKNWAGERVIYFSTDAGTRRINLDQPLPTNNDDFDKVTSLFLEYDLPKVEYVGEGSSGQVPTGAYQFAVRLVTESGAKTSFGILSNIASVIQSSLQSSRDSVVGNPPQTPTTKSVLLKITNIDPTFKYLEVGVLTYIGLSNTPVIMGTNLVTINSQKTIQYTYRGEPDHSGTIPLSEFIVTGVSYLSGSYLTQKDGSLLIANPTEAAQPPINWHRVASNIVSEYVIKKIHYQEFLQFEATNDEEDATKYGLIETSDTPMDQGYHNPITASKYKGYRRDEVYAFTLTPVFVSGVYGPTVHIPAGDDTPTLASVAQSHMDDGGLLGTYISEEKYPNDDYPGITPSDGLRLHKFPNAEQQPLISGNVETGDCYIRVIGVKFSNIVLDASELQYAPQIAGFIIGRVNRTGNETQLAQGIVRPHVHTQFNSDTRFGRGTLLGDGFAGWLSRPVDEAAKYTARSSEDSEAYPDLTSFNFIAPDLIHNLYTAESASHISQHSVYTANPYASPTSNWIVRARTPRDGFNMPKVFFKNITGESSHQLDQTKTELDGLKIDVPAFGVPLAPSEKGGKIETAIIKGGEVITMCSSDGFVWLSTKNSIPIKYHRPHGLLYRSFDQVGQGDDAKQFLHGLHDIGNFRTDFVLHTLSRVDNKQYGPLDQMVSMFTHYSDWKGFSGTVEFFNGDTFINKYGLSINDEANYPYVTNDDAGRASGDPDYLGHLKPPTVSGIVYMWIESNNNYAYRHYIQPEAFSETNVNKANGSTPFYPAYKQLTNSEQPMGILSMHAENWRRPGYASQYNNQYSAQPTIKPFVQTPKEDISRRNSLVNRVIYSAQAVQGEKSDAYQIFLPNNYYDVPQEFGELTDIYTKGGELFASTKHVQWRLFYNTLATQATSAGEVVLGSGGAFNRPAVPLTSADGGYGGTSHWTHAVDTIVGRVFVDKVQGKFFVFSEGLKDFSNSLDDTYRVAIQKIDNDDIKVGSEPLRERVFFRLGNQTWSFNLESQIFVSRHSFTPRWMFSHGPYMFSNQIDPTKGNKGVFKHSVGPAGQYYGVRKNSDITLIYNVGKFASKQFNVLEIISRKITENKLNLPFNTFDEIEIWNDERYSGKNKIKLKANAFELPGVLEVLASKVKDSFRVTVPRDIVVDPSKDIFAISNHAQVSSDLNRAKWLPKMRGNFIHIKLISHNQSGPIFLNGVLVGATENIR